MKNMFKKTLVAAALAGLSTTASAAVIQATDNTGAITGPTFPVNVSSEYLSLAADDEYDSGDLIVELGAEYAVNDTVTITANIAPETFPANATVGASGSLKGITFGLVNVSSDGRTATYRVTEVSGGSSDLTTGVEVNFGEFTFGASDVASAGSASIEYRAWAGAVDSTPLDRSGDNAATLINVASQFAYGADPVFDQVISVEENRQEFTDGSGLDDASFTIASATVFDNEADVDSVVYTLSGNFSWVDADPTVYAAVFDFTCGGSGVVSDEEYTASAVSFACDTGEGADITIDATQNTDWGTADAATLIAGNFNLTAEAAYSVATETGSASVSGSAGRWTLDGSSVFVPYMPYASNISQVLLVTNDGSQDGMVTVEGYDEDGNVFDPFEIGVSEAGTTMRITGDVKDGLEAQGLTVDGSTKRVALRITTNVPDGDVTVYSAYNVNGTGARLVVNDSNGTKED